MACGSPGGEDAGPLEDSGTTDNDSGVGAIDAGEGDGGGPMACSYPPGQVEPMAVGATLWPYAWPEAIDGAGNNFPLDLQQVACNTDPNIDWSPFDVLVFIAIPAW